MTANWLIKLALEGHPTFTGGNIGLFRVFLALGILIKFSVETYRGHYSYFDEDGYLSARYNAIYPNNRLLTEALWKALYILKVPAALLLLLGLFPKACLLALIVGFSVELRVFFKFHANYMLLLCVGLLFSRSIGDSFSVVQFLSAGSLRDFFRISLATQEYALVPLYIAATMTALYWFSVLHKCTRLFLSGRIVATTLHVLTLEGPRRRFTDFRLPACVLRRLIDADGGPTRLLGLMMWTVLAAELLIPVGLLFEQTAAAAIVGGIALHAGLLLLLPTTLLDFSLVAVGAYVVFIDPRLLADVIR